MSLAQPPMQPMPAGEPTAARGPALEWSDAALAELHQMVKDRQTLLHFDAPGLEGAFVRERRQQFIGLSGLAGGLFLMLLLLQACLAVIFEPDLVGNSSAAFWGLWGLSMLAIPITLWVVPRVSPRYFEAVVSAGSVVLLGCAAGLLTQTTAQAYLLPALGHLFITMLAVILTSRLRMAACLRTVVVSIGLLLFMGHWLREAPTPLSNLALLRTLLPFMGVLLFVGLLRESADRLAFAQGVLLEQQSRRIADLQVLLVQRSREDQVTGLPSRQVFRDVLNREWERNIREKKQMSLLLLDIDYFRLYNRHYGVEAGDRTLRLLAEQLQFLLLRPADQLFRMESDRMAILLPGTPLVGAQKVAQRVMQLLERMQIPHRWSQVATHLTLSIGHAHTRPTDGGASVLLDRAEHALLHAKREGRHRVVCSETGTTAPHLVQDTSQI